MPWTLAFVLVVCIPLIAVNYYVVRRYLRALESLTSWNKKHVRTFCVGLHVFVNLLPIVYLLAYVVVGRGAGPAFSGDSRIVDLLLSYPFWMSLVIVGQLFALFVVLDVIEIFVLRFVPAVRGSWPRISAWIITALLVVVPSFSIVKIVQDTWGIRITEYDIIIPDEYKSLAGLRIAQISDVQGDGRTTYDDLRRYVEKVNLLHPDLVVFAGDLVTWGTRYIDTTAEIMGGLKSRFGTIAAVGDHDLFSDKVMVVEAMRRSGISILEDTTAFLRVGISTMAISVVAYTYMQRPTQARLNKLSEVANGSYKVMLVHQPAENLVEFARQHDYRLFMAGHTHGGSLAFGIPGLFLLAPANFESRYVSGIYTAGELVVSVTNGLGLTLTPIRYNAPAEITMINLKTQVKSELKQ